MKEIFTIGETAKINKISVQTLRYYDAINLLKPHYINDENGYRFYHLSQFQQLDQIKFLKHIKISLEEIKTIIKSREPTEVTCQYIETQYDKINDEINNLKKMQTLLMHRKKLISDQDLMYKELNTGNVYQRNLDTEVVYAIKYEYGINSEFDLDRSIRNLIEKTNQESVYFDNYIGLLYEVGNVHQKNDVNRVCVFVGSAEPLTEDFKKGVIKSEINGGTYLCISFLWSHDNMLKNVEYLRKYAESNQLNICDKMVQVSYPINYLKSDELDFITEVRVEIIEKV